MEIIIHGKPHSESKLTTNGLENSLVDKISGNFFSEMGVTRNDKALVVDILYWQKVWYTVYTYSKYTNIRDSAGRQSYFALSLVIPQHFFYLTSEVYKLLDKVYKANLEGVYISADGQYAVGSFGGTEASFNAVVEAIDAEFAKNPNLQDPIDNTFTLNRSGQIIHYNLIDCDSRAFLNDLRQHGRIIVGEGSDFPAKCSVSELQNKENAIQKLNAKIAELKGENLTLTKKMEDAINNGDSNTKRHGEKVQQLENEKKNLEQQLEEKQRQLTNEQDAHKKLIDGVKALLPPTMQRQEQPTEHNTSTTHSKYMRYIPMLNTAFLIICILLLLLESGRAPVNNVTFPTQEMEQEAKQLHDTIQKWIVENETLLQENKILKQENETLAKKIENLSNNNLSNENTQGNTKKQDIDCNVTITKLVSGKPLVNNSKINKGDTIKITWTYKDGYQWYTDNLASQQRNILRNSNKEDSCIIILNKSNENKPIILWYRTENKDNRNDINKLTL